MEKHGLPVTHFKITSKMYQHAQQVKDYVFEVYDIIEDKECSSNIRLIPTSLPVALSAKNHKEIIDGFCTNLCTVFNDADRLLK